MSQEAMVDGGVVLADAVWNMTVGELIGKIVEQEGLVRFLTRLPESVIGRNLAIRKVADDLLYQNDELDRRYGDDNNQCGNCQLFNDVKGNCDECPIGVEAGNQIERGIEAMEVHCYGARREGALT